MIFVFHASECNLLVLPIFLGRLKKASYWCGTRVYKNNTLIKLENTTLSNFFSVQRQEICYHNQNTWQTQIRSEDVTVICKQEETILVTRIIFSK